MSDSLEIIKVPGNNYQFSATRLDALESFEYTLVTLVVDTSGSVSSYAQNLEKCIQEVVKACRYSPRADNLMLRIVLFDSTVRELHGYKLLSECNLNDYIGALRCGGMTALYDACVDAVQAANVYGQKLTELNYAVNGLTVIITDGEDNQSSLGSTAVRTALQQSTQKEYMESMLSILIGVTSDQSLDGYLKDFSDSAGIDQYQAIGSASDKVLAKLADFVSKSISSQSMSLGSGSASKPISYTF